MMNRSGGGGEVLSQDLSHYPYIVVMYIIYLLFFYQFLGLLLFVPSFYFSEFFLGFYF